MTEKEKTIELSTEPTEKKKPHRRRAVVITVVALALLAAGGIAWKTHTDRLMAEARADCAAESERLHVATTAYNALLDDQCAVTTVLVQAVLMVQSWIQIIQPLKISLQQKISRITV